MNEGRTPRPDWLAKYPEDPGFLDRMRRLLGSSYAPREEIIEQREAVDAGREPYVPSFVSRDKKKFNKHGYEQGSEMGEYPSQGTLGIKPQRDLTAEVEALVKNPFKDMETEEPLGTMDNPKTPDAPYTDSSGRIVQVSAPLRPSYIPVGEIPDMGTQHIEDEYIKMMDQGVVTNEESFDLVHDTFGDDRYARMAKEAERSGMVFSEKENKPKVFIEPIAQQHTQDVEIVDDRDSEHDEISLPKREGGMRVGRSKSSSLSEALMTGKGDTYHLRAKGFNAKKK